MGRTIEALIVAGLVGVGTTAGYVVANEALDSSNTIEGVSTEQANNCANAVLDAAQIEFRLEKNDPTTKADEAFDSRERAKNDGQEFVDDEFVNCLNAELIEKFNVYVDNIETPKFNPGEEQ